uniref:Ras-GAP domain-containing protein n=1 Tax=Oncorhynchus tshawytscha TaxID=74940 RepID=A0AAZ3Q6P3_ONCTS
MGGGGGVQSWNPLSRSLWRSVERGKQLLLHHYLIHYYIFLSFLCFWGNIYSPEEEINNMKWDKIGGILANEITVDEAAIHAAVIAINEAVERGDLEVNAQALRNPSAMLTNLQEHLMPVYQEMLHQARAQKAALAYTKCNCSEEKDIYEEHLTQSEIQENIDKINGEPWIVGTLAILAALQVPCLALRGLQRYHGTWISDMWQDLGCVDPLERDELQKEVCVANEEAQSNQTMQKAVRSINDDLRLGEPRQTVRALMDPEDISLNSFSLEYGPLCLQGDLQQEELYVAVEILSAVALINQAVEAKDVGAFCATLVSPAAGLADIDDSLVQRYFEELGDQRRKAGRALLTWNNLQRGPNSVNAAAQEEHDQILAIGLINQALCRGDLQKALAALLLPSSGLEELTTLNARRYHDVLTRGRRQKAEVSELWLADIQEGVRRANHDTQRAPKMSLGLVAVNQAVEEGKTSQTLRVLHLPEVALWSVVEECAGVYKAEITTLLLSQICGRSVPTTCVHAGCDLLYVLQTQPLYLAQLIFLKPQNKTTLFMETVIFTLFNYGSDCREAYLLLQLFTPVLRHEIKSVYTHYSHTIQVVTGNPTVIKMLVSFYRHARSQTALKEILGLAIREVLQDCILSIRTDPCEIDKSWVNQTETQTSHKRSALSQEQILDSFSLATGVQRSPSSHRYGRRYTATVLRDSLHEKFPQASEDELYKVHY